MSYTHRTGPGSRRVVVGVDGSAASANALRYARAEAARHGVGVDVIHVVPDYSPIAGMYPVLPDELMAAGRAALRSAVAQVEDEPSDVATATHLQHGSVITTLAAAGEGSCGIVVGSDRRPVAMRLLTGNVSTGVAARASVPVVSVPDTWRADRSTGVVLVGVKRTDKAGALLAQAFAVAQQRHCRLLVLHAWRLPSGYDDLIADRAAFEDWEQRAQRELGRLVAPWQRRHPEVEVTFRIVHDQAAHALVEASSGADELVIVRRTHGIPAAAHLGSTARTVLLYAHCPVRVIPGVDAPLAPDLVLEGAGAP